MDEPCPYCQHPYAEHKEDSGCECSVPGCDCNLTKVMGALGAKGSDGEPLR